MTPFEPLDRVPAPDLWPEIERRAEVGEVLDEGGGGRQRRLLVVAAVATLVAVAGAALAWSASDGEGDEVRTAATDAPELACIDGGLARGAIPEDAAETPLPGSRLVAGGHARTWTEAGLTVELLVPAPHYDDFVGERTEPVDDPDGMLWYRNDGAVVLLAATGLAVLADLGIAGPCAGYQLTVSGGDEADEAGLVLAIARRFSWRSEFGVTDCGPLSPRAINVVHGPTAAVALTDPGVAGLTLLPDTLDELSTVTRRTPEGACYVNARTRGGLRPMVVVSGSDGRYGVDWIRGLSPDRGADPEEMDGSLSVQVLGRTFSAFFGFWCDACVRTRVTLLYPDQELHGSAEIDGPGDVSGELTRAPAAGSYGILVIEVEEEDGSLRGLHVTAISSGDFAAS